MRMRAVAVGCAARARWVRGRLRLPLVRIGVLLMWLDATACRMAAGGGRAGGSRTSGGHARASGGRARAACSVVRRGHRARRTGQRSLRRLRSRRCGRRRLASPIRTAGGGSGGGG